MQVKDIMVPVAGAVTQDMTLRQAAERMRALDIDPMPVTDGDQVVGLLSSGALRETAASEMLATGSKTVEAVMSTDVVCCTDDATISNAIRHVEDTLGPEASGRVPVTDGAGRLLGIVAISDLRAHEHSENDGVAGAQSARSAETVVDFEDDRVDHMSVASFPASDPPAPQSTTSEDTDRAE